MRNSLVNVLTIGRAITKLCGPPIGRIVESDDDGVLTVQEVEGIFSTVWRKDFRDHDSIVTVDALDLEDADLGAFVTATNDHAGKGAQEKRNYLIKRSNTRFFHLSSSWV